MQPEKLKTNGACKESTDLNWNLQINNHLMTLSLWNNDIFFYIDVLIKIRGD